MVDFITTIIDFVSTNFPYIAIAVGIVVAGVWFLTRYESKDHKFKPVVLEKEIHKDFNEVFKLTQEPIGYGKTLFIGSRQAGFVMKSIYINFFIDKEKKPNLKRTANVTKLTTKHKSVEAVLDKNGMKKFYGFRVCGKSRIERILANLFDVGTRIFLIDSEIVEESESSFNVNPYCKPERYFNIWIYSRTGKKVVDEIAFKINQEQMLNSMVNYLPKLSFHEIEQSKQKAQLDIFEEMQRQKRKDTLEQIKKA